MIRALFAGFLCLAFAAPSQRTPEFVVAALASRVTSLDPLTLAEIDAYDVTGYILEPLARKNYTTGQIEPWLAERWSLDKAHRRLTLNLRRGVFFHDGSILKADDVAFTFNAYRSPEAAKGLWPGMWRDIESVSARTPSMVEIEFKELTYSAYLNALTGLRVLPRSFYAGADFNKRREHVVGTGPFRLQRFLSGQSIELQPFENWWGLTGSAVPFHVLFKTVTNQDLALRMVERGELDFFSWPSQATELADGHSVRLVSTKSVGPEGLWISLNLRRNLFKNQQIRQALWLLWDRKKLNDRLYKGRYRLANDTFSGVASANVFDKERARWLLAKEGWLDSNKDSVLDRLRNGQREDFVFTVLVGSRETERWVSLFQSDLAQAGIRVKIRLIEENGQFLKTVQEGLFDAVAGQGGMSLSVDPSSWMSNGVYNFTGYQNPLVDSLLKQLESEFNEDQRRILEAKLIERIRDDLPQLPGLATDEKKVLLSQRLSVDFTHPRQAWRWEVSRKAVHE